MQDHSFIQYISLTCFLNWLLELFQIDCYQFEQVLLVLFIFPKTEFKCIFSLPHICEVSKSINPFEFFTTLNSKFIGSLHELTIGQLNSKCLEQKLSFGKNINLFIVIGHPLVEYIPLCTVIHLFHHFFLSIYCFIRFFLVNMALEVIFMVRFPRSRTHITEVFSTSTSHKITAHSPLNSFFAPWTDLSIGRYPFSISFFSHNLLDPWSFLLTFARVVVIRHASKTKYLSAITTNSVNV